MGKKIRDRCTILLQALYKRFIRERTMNPVFPITCFSFLPRRREGVVKSRGAKYSQTRVE